MTTAKKAQLGDTIISYDYDFGDRKDRHSDYVIGVVTEIAPHPVYGYESVSFTVSQEVLVDRYTGDIEEIISTTREMRCPQNGTPTTMGKKTNNIRVIKITKE